MNKLRKIIIYFIRFLAFIFPLFFLTVTPESYEINKLALLILSSLILSAIASIYFIKQKQMKLTGGSFATVLFLLCLLMIASSFIQSSNFVITLITPLSTSTVVFGFLLYLLILNFITNNHSPNTQKDQKYTPQTMNKDVKDTHPLIRYYLDEKHSSKDITKQNNHTLAILNAFTLSGIILSIYVFMLYAGLFPLSLFTPAGNLLASSVFLLIIFIYSLFRLYFLIKTASEGKSKAKDLHQIIFQSAAFIVTGGAASLLIIHLFTDQKPAILPFSFGWIIFLEILKNIKSLLLGIGPSNFTTAFTLAKPVSINTTPFWNVIFTTSSSYLLTLATEAGIAVMILYFYLIIKSVKIYLTEEKIWKKPIIGSLIILLLSQIFLPSSMTLFFLTIIFLALSSSRKNYIYIDLTRLGKSVYFILLPIFTLIIIILYFGSKYYLAEVYFKKSLDALVNNKGRDVYNYQLQAKNFNPQIDRYRRSFSQTNLALANSIASKGELTDEEKQTIPRLIQQAIDEARNAVALNRTNVINWDNLATTYASLINFADKSKDWTIRSYEQRIRLDPVNPSARFAFGRFYFNIEDYVNAEKLLQQAVNLKNDFANAHYYLAQVYKKQDKNDLALTQLQITSSLISSGTDEAGKVEEEIGKLKEIISQASASADIYKQDRNQETEQGLELIDQQSSPSALENLPSSEQSISLPAPP